MATDRLQDAQKLTQAFASADAKDVPLDEKLAEYADRSREILPEVLAAYDRLVARLEKAGAGSGAPAVGEELPSFALPDNTGRIVHLAQLLGHGPVVVSFNRGHWCPYCRLELRALMRAAVPLRQRLVEIVSIMPETGEIRDSMVAEHALPFRVLTDMDLGYTLSLGLAVAVDPEVVEIYRELGIDLPRFQGRDGWFLPIPATYVVDRNQRIKAGLVNPDFRKRMTLEQIEVALKA